MSEGSTRFLEVRDVVKRFHGVVALKGVSWSAKLGEVHALVGANGAGKSTLMNLLAGADVATSGDLLVNGQLQRFTNPAEAQALGIATVYQEFSLIPQVSTARNIYLGREPKSRFGLIDESLLHDQCNRLLDRYSLRIDPSAEVSSLSVAQQQLVEIARALSLRARVLILDEPTAVLSISEQQNLFSIVRKLKNEGLLVLFVSHHLNEVLQIADRVTVLRDGHKVATRHVDEHLSVDDLVCMMTGQDHRPTQARNRRDRSQSGRSVSVAYHVAAGTSEIRAEFGEIVGIAGHIGAGRTTFARALFGMPLSSSRVDICLDNKDRQFSSPHEAVSAGVIYLTEDRKRDGIFANLDIIANTTAASLNQVAKGLFRSGRTERRLAAQVLKRLRLVARSMAQPVFELSGGNQQKVIIGRALLTKPRVLICDEPTRGVDVATKTEIHQILRDLADEDVAVLLISSEFDELLSVADRIVVMRNFKFVDKFFSCDTDETGLLLAASGAPQHSAKQADLS